MWEHELNVGVVLRVLAAAGAALAALLLASVSAFAAVDPYTAGATGYDDGPAQCATAARGAFGVIAVNSGRPFSANSCLASEAASAAGGGLYVNTGYSKAYANRIDPGCATRSDSYSSSSLRNQAYAIGCSEAVQSEGVAAAAALTTPVWWLDVETANSWSSGRLDLNRATLEGLVDELKTTGAAVGVYSTAQQWAAIAGSGWAPVGLDANWVAGASSAATAPAACTASFTGAPVWLVQYVTTLDQDYAC